MRHIYRQPCVLCSLPLRRNKSCSCHLWVLFNANFYCSFVREAQSDREISETEFSSQGSFAGKKKSLLSTCILTKIHVQIFNVERFRVYRLKLPQQHPLLYGWVNLIHQNDRLVKKSVRLLPNLCFYISAGHFPRIQDLWGFCTMAWHLNNSRKDKNVH